MHQTVNIVLQLHKRAKAGELCYLAVNQVAYLIFLIDCLPGIFGELFDPEADPLVYFVDVDHDGFDFVAFLKYFAGMIDLAGPAQIGHVNHPIDAFVQFHERAVCSHIANLTFDPAADGEFLLDLIPRIRFQLAQTQ